jgi:DedD protein
MASTASPEASEIRRRGRQRLIGAIALVMVLVVFVPMVLDSEPRPTQPVAPIPSKDNPAPLPAPAPKAAASSAAVPAKPAPGVDNPGAGIQATEPTKVLPEAAKAPAPAAKPAPSAPEKTPAAPSLEGFAVQVGAFRDEAKLKQARDKLAAAGVVHYTERLDSPGGPLTRLRAGPFATREAAESAQASLKRVALEGKVVPLP